MRGNVEQSGKGKTKSLMIHTAKRALERYGCILTKKDQKAIVRIIQNEKASFIHKESNRVTVWDVDFEGKTFRVCYDKIRKSIVTVLPSENSIL